MKLPQARFITSATRLEECPPATKPEYAIVGRSNVGKSSLINALAHHNNLARTSRTPGRTRLINFFDFGPFMIADLPGYGYAKVSKSVQAYWGQELTRFLREREGLAGVVHLMDARHPLQPNDREMAALLESFGLPVLLVLTKADELKQSEQVKSLRLVQAETGDAPILFSARTGRGKRELLSALTQGAPEEAEPPLDP